MSIQNVMVTADVAARRRSGVMAGARRPRRAAGAGLARDRAGAAVAAHRDRCVVRRRQRRGAGDRAGNPAAAGDSGIRDRRHARAVRRGIAGAAAQSAGLAFAVRRAAIGRLRRGAGDRARSCRCALLCASGRGDRRGVRLGVRAADDRGPQCRPADSDPGGSCDLEPCGRRHRAGDESVQQSLRGARDRVLAARLAGGSQLSPRHAGAAVHRGGRDHSVEPAQCLPRAQPRRGDRAKPWRRCRPAAADRDRRRRARRRRRGRGVPAPSASSVWSRRI